MNNVEIIGGTAQQKKYVESMVHFCIKKLMPKVRTLDLEIKLKTIKDDVYGYCLSVTRREFEIEVDRNLSLRRLLTTVAHEMVHVKQYARGELKGDYIWHGKTYHPKKVDYWDEPWEIEAHGRECGLFIRWAEEEGIGHKKWTHDS